MTNEKNPLVSIIIPTYNNSDTICRSVNSCMNQTYKNIEIIVIDDGSTDNTREVLSKYNADKRFKYIHQKNQERSAARNHGLDIAKGEYIQFLDSDDEIYSTKIEKQVNFLNSNYEYFLVYCGVEYKDILGQISYTLEPKKDENIDQEILKGNFLVIHSPLFRKTSVRFDTRINRLEDWKFWIYVVKNKKVAYIDDILCNVYIQKQVSKRYIIRMIIGDIFLYFILLKDRENFNCNKFKIISYQIKRVLYLIYNLLKIW